MAPPPPIDDEFLLEVLPDPVVVIAADGTLLWANPEAVATFRWSLEDWIGRPSTDLVHPDDLPMARDALASIGAKAVGSLIEVRIRTGDGTWRLTEVRGRVALAGPEAGVVVLVARDITGRRRWELAAGEAAVVQAVVHHTPVIFVLLDNECGIRSASAALLRTLGQPLEASIGRSFLDLVDGRDRTVVSDALDCRGTMGRTATVEAHLLHRDGHPVLHQLTITALTDDPVVAGTIVTAQDISELERSRRRLRHLATHDGLTGLLNRSGLIESLRRRPPTDAARAVVFVDLDDFKVVNDRLGHVSGDRVLQVVAGRLAASAAAVGIVGRLGGDEFLAVVEGDDPDSAAQRLVGELVAAVGQPIDIAGEQVQVRASCGVAVVHAGDDLERAMAAADVAMYRAKAAGARRSR